MGAKDFLTFKNWCVVGDVGNEKKYAYKILNKLNEKGYNVVGVSLKGGENIFKSLSEVPYNIEVIDLCINPIKGIEFIKEAKILGINKVLIQPGAESEEVLNFCKENGICAIEGCALVELSRR
ncbi:TPA: CoA-binding protein [Clostridium perfringens]|nr:CoA-binding protein [Clostridium perfringens]HAT4347220.1 CoA-binding protein [Clostridium perfringens]